MIITISGTPGSGKSSVAKIVASKLGLRHLSAGDFMRQMAQERGVTLLELSKQAEKDDSIDHEIDKRTKLLEKDDNFVMDSRLAFHFLPKSVKVFLKVDLNVAVQRIHGDITQNRRAVEKDVKTKADAKNAIERRKKSESLRYKKLYGIDYLDESHYDLVIDTTNESIESCAQKVIDFAEIFLNKRSSA